jgi:hypothetical protein
MQPRATTLTLEEHTQLLHTLCQQQLNLSIPQLLSTIPHLDKLRTLLSEDNLYVQRFAGILRSTTKEDPFDCTYVKKCAIVFMENPKEFTELKNTIKKLHEILAHV